MAGNARHVQLTATRLLAAVRQTEPLQVWSKTL